MVGKLTRFEIKKMLGGKFFLIVLCLLLAVNVLLNCGFQDFMRAMDAVENGAALGEVTEESTSFFGYSAAVRKATQFSREQYALFESLTPEERSAFEVAMEETYGKNVWDTLLPTDAMFQTPDYFGKEWGDFTHISHYQLLTLQNQDMKKAMETVVRAAKAFGREALEAGDNYGIRRNQRIIRLYSKPRGQITTPILGWSDYLFESPTMLLVFALLLLACAGSFSGERDRQTWLLLHTARNGKGRTLLAKYLAGAITAAGLTILFQLVTLLSVCFKMGLLGAAQPVASLEELKLFPYLLTVWQYALLALACQLFAAVVLSVLLNTISALSRSSIVSYAAGAIVLSGCLLLVYHPPRAELLAGPLSLSNPVRFFSSYYTANLFGFPVLWAAVQAALWCFLSACCIFLAQKIYHRKRGAV